MSHQIGGLRGSVGAEKVVLCSDVDPAPSEHQTQREAALSKTEAALASAASTLAADRSFRTSRSTSAKIPKVEFGEKRVRGRNILALKPSVEAKLEFRDPEEVLIETDFLVETIQLSASETILGSPDCVLFTHRRALDLEVITFDDNERE